MAQASISDRKRYRVLFEVWCRNESEVAFNFQACSECAFVIYAPRPSTEDLDAKYRFLVDLSRTQPDAMLNPVSEEWRARRLARDLRPYARTHASARILDFGGGRGGLLQYLLAQGHRCAVIDWCDTPVAGVERLGATLDDVDTNRRFDICVASHVLEHVAEPRMILERLRGLLSPGGTLYVEVPMEIWGGPPRMTEPVTHVNFFIPISVERMLANAGFETISCRLGMTQYGGQWIRVVRAFARVRTSGRVESRSSAMQELSAYLRPTRLMRIQSRLSAPGSWYKAVFYRSKKLLKRG